MPQNDPRWGPSGLAGVSDFPSCLAEDLMSGIWTQELLYSWSHRDWKYSGALCKSHLWEGNVSPSSLQASDSFWGMNIGCYGHNSCWDWSLRPGQWKEAHCYWSGGNSETKPVPSAGVFWRTSESPTCPAWHGRIFQWCPPPGGDGNPWRQVRSLLWVHGDVQRWDTTHVKSIHKGSGFNLRDILHLWFCLRISPIRHPFI